MTSQRPAEQTSAPSSDRRIWVALAMVLLATLMVFWRLTSAQFVNYDDPDFVTNNPRILGGLSLDAVRWAFGSTMIYWQPLTWISYLLDMRFWGLDPKGFHLTNLILHTLNTGLVFLALRRLTIPVWTALLVAAWFAWHPLHVESVAWISERKGLLSAVFGLLALHAYARYAEKPGAGRYAAVVAFFALSLMAKSMFITLPCLCLLLDVWPLKRAPLLTPAGPGRLTWGQWIGEKIPLFLMCAASAWVTLLAQRQASALLTLDQVPLPARLANAVVSYVVYLRRTIWPSDLTAYYPYMGQWPLATVAIAAVLLIVLTVGALLAFRKSPGVTIGWLWFLGTLVPVIGIVQAGDQAMADRYSYLPLIGVFLAVACGVETVLGSHEALRRIGTFASVASLGACIWAAQQQAATWRDTRSLFGHMLEVNPRNFLAQTAMGSLYLEAGNPKSALKHLQEAVRLRPDYPEAWLCAGTAHERMEELPEAEREYRRALELRPGLPEALNALGMVLAARNDLTGATNQYLKALESRPAFAEAHHNLAIVYLRMGETTRATEHFDQAVRLKPALIQTRLNLARTLQREGKPAEAVEHYRGYLRARPDDQEARLDLALALLGLGNQQQAGLEEANVATAKLANPVQALNRLAWQLSTHRDPKARNGLEAVKFARRACELTHFQDAVSLNSLAAAQAETGDFTSAVETARKAVEASQAAGAAQMAQAIGALLEGYARGEAHRE